MKLKRLTFLSLYCAIALAIYGVESAIPPLVPIAGVKLGLANVVTLWLLMYAKKLDALLVLLVRIVLSGIFMGQLISFSFSLCGGLVCFAAMAFLFSVFGRKALVYISILGAIAHNLGQILAAVFLLQTFSILAYAPVLIISAILTGTFAGLCARYASKKLPASLVWPIE